MTKVHLIAEPGTLSVVMTRAFNAPRDLVFRAFTDPTLLTRWWGASGNLHIDKLDAQPGGMWRFVEKDATSGAEYGFFGVFHQVTAPERIVQTFEFEGMPGHVLMETIAFEERDGQTYMTDTSVFQSVEARDGMIASGMEEGSNIGFDRLDGVLAGQ